MPDQVRHDDVGAWIDALAAFGAAEAGLVAVEQALCGRTAAPRAAVAEHDVRLAAMYEALRHLLLIPAPDRAALARKVALAEDHDVASLPGGEACVTAIRADARRLAGI
jgi:hypothetical protein